MIMSFWVKLKTTSISSNPLFSSIVTLYALIFLYLPTHFTTIVFSPVLILTATLLLSLLRLGASQSHSPNGTNDKTTVQAEEDHDPEWSETDSEPDLGPSFEASFVQWDLRAPLEVIYEDEDENDVDLGVVERHRRYFPDSESDNSSDGDFSGIGFWDSPENLSFKWEDEDRDEGLIEIALDHGSDSENEKSNCELRLLDFNADEDNLIEIDISAQEIPKELVEGHRTELNKLDIHRAR